MLLNMITWGSLPGHTFYITKSLFMYGVQKVYTAYGRVESGRVPYYSLLSTSYFPHAQLSAYVSDTRALCSNDVTDVSSVISFEAINEAWTAAGVFQIGIATCATCGG